MLSPTQTTKLVTLTALFVGLSIPAQAQDFNQFNAPEPAATQETHPWADFSAPSQPQIQPAPAPRPALQAGSLPATSTASVDITVAEPSDYRQGGAGLLPESGNSGSSRRGPRGVRRAI